MKQILLISLLLLISACNHIQKAPLKPIGGDRDAHGCLPSAGYRWSVLLEDCIRVFEVGLRLNPIEVDENQAVISAFIVYNDDLSKAELLLSGDSYILEKKDVANFIYKNYRFDAHHNILYINDKKAYR